MLRAFIARRLHIHERRAAEAAHLAVDGSFDAGMAIFRLNVVRIALGFVAPR